MQANRIKKRKLRAKTSLSYKLTAYFVVFGLIIGYTVFIFSTTFNGRQVLETFSGAAIREINPEDMNFKDFNISVFSDELTAVFEAIDHNDLPIDKIDAFIEENGTWEKYSFVDNEIRLRNIEPAEMASIYKALDREITFEGDFFFGKTDKTTIYLNLNKGQKPDFIIAASVTREGFKGLISRSKNQLIGFTVFLFIMSFLLGNLFSTTVTRPLRKLTQKAVEISEGNQDVTLRINRRDEIGVLSKTLSQMRDDLQERLKAMEIMNRIDKAVLSSISRTDLLNRVVGFVCEYIDKSTVVMAQRDEKGGGFELLSAVRQSESAMKIDNPYIPDELLSPDTLSAFKHSCVFSEDQNLTEVLIKQLHLPKNTRRFYNVALYMRENYIGSLFVIREDQQPFTEEQQQTLRKLGDQVGVAMQSVMAVEEINSLQIGSIQALSRSIDAKSQWTAGHSGRVAELSEMLGAAIGLEEMQLRRLMISALLHDIGKIGISEAILDKPGRLTDEEFGIIKQHPQLGFEISRNIPNYEDICDGIRFHHERWNGTGYPTGIGANEIPQFGRIIAIADVFDAITADRPYRKGMSLENSLQFMEDRRGIDFDSEMAEIFIDLIKNSNNYLFNPEAGVKL